MLASLGCRGATGVQVDAMERELRMQEDYIYELEDYLVEYSTKLRAYRCALQDEQAKPTTRSRVPTLAEDDLRDDDLQFEEEPDNRRSSNAVDRSDDTRDSDADEIPEPDTIESPEIDELPPYEMEVPDLDIGAQTSTDEEPSPLFATAEPEHRFASSATTPSGKVPVFIPSPVGFQSSEQPDTAEDDIEQVDLDEAAEGLALSDAAGNRLEADATEEEFTNEEFTGEEFIDAKPIQPLAPPTPDRIVVRQLLLTPAEGDKSTDDVQTGQGPAGSLLAVVEVRDPSDEPIEADGTVSVMVMADDGAAGPRRLHRWDFTAEEAAAAWQSSEFGDGLHLELPLEGQPLPEGPLALWARLVSADGQKYLTRLALNRQELAVYDGRSVAPAIEDSPVEQGLGETRLAARSQDSHDVGEDASVGDSPELQPGSGAPRWRMSNSPGTVSGNFATTASSTRPRWSSQIKSGESAPTPASVATPEIPKPLAGDAGDASSSTGSTVWRTVQPGR